MKRRSLTKRARALVPFSPVPVALVLVALTLGRPPAAAVPTEHIDSIINASDLFKLQQVESPRISPDGRWVVFTMRSIGDVPAPAQKIGYLTRLWLVPADGHEPPHPIAPDGDGTDPSWSPDGARIAFVRPVKTKPQIFILTLPPTGSPTVTPISAPVQVTFQAEGATRPRWSPDGRQILYSGRLFAAELLKAHPKATAPWPQERPGRVGMPVANPGSAAPPSTPESLDTLLKFRAELEGAADAAPGRREAWLSAHESHHDPRVTTRINFEGEGDLEPDVAFEHVFVAAMATPDQAETATDLTPDFGSYSEAAWAPDSRHVICVGPDQPDRHPDRDQTTELVLLDTGGGAPERLALEGFSLSEPHPSPDGKTVAFLAVPANDLAYGQPAIGVEPLEVRGPGRLLTEKFDRRAHDLQWSRDGHQIYFVAPAGGSLPLYRIGLQPGAKPERLINGDLDVQAYDVGAESVALALSRITDPSELFVGDAGAKQTRVLTEANSRWIEGKLISTPDHRVLDRPGGFKMDAWLMKPANFEGAKYPLITAIHGGPNAMWGPAEPTLWFEFQYLAARGYGVVYCNPRGSSGSGRAYERANYRDWGPGPASDVLAAVDMAAAEPWVDTAQEFLEGGSYGGYLTAWIVAHDHRFKAAVAERGVYDLSTFFGEGNAWRLVPREFGGYPWEPEVRAVLDANSPIYFVQAITTPLLIEQGDNDLRVGPAQSEMLYRSLKVLGRPVEYVRYPRATHELSRSGEPQQRADRLVRYDDFFERYFTKP